MEKLSVATKTKSFTYMLPMLGLALTEFKSNIVNAFIGDEDYPELDNHIFVLYEFQGSTAFVAYENYLEQHPLFVRSYDPEKKYVMKVFRITESMQADYDTLKRSKYSEVSMVLKTKIIAFHGLPPEHPISDVLFKREAAFLRLEAELNKYDNTSRVHVDRHLEASGLLDLSRELYNSNYKTVNPLEMAKEQFLEEGLV